MRQKAPGMDANRYSNPATLAVSLVEFNVLSPFVRHSCLKYGPLAAVLVQRKNRPTVGLSRAGASHVTVPIGPGTAFTRHCS